MSLCSTVHPFRVYRLMVFTILNIFDAFWLLRPWNFCLLKKGVFIMGNFRYIQSRAEEYNEPQVPNTRLPSDQSFVFTLAPSVRWLWGTRQTSCVTTSVNVSVSVYVRWFKKKMTIIMFTSIDFSNYLILTSVQISNVKNCSFLLYIFIEFLLTCKSAENLGSC